MIIASLLFGALFFAPIAASAQSPAEDAAVGTKKNINVGATVTSNLAKVHPIFLAGVAMLSISGHIFDFVMFNFVLQFGSFYDKHLKNAVDIAWTTLRDLANTVFVFYLLYVSIMIIIGGVTAQKKTIIVVLVAALLINFSLLITKVIIDVGNLAAVQMYSTIVSNQVDELNTVDGKVLQNYSIGDRVFSRIGTATMTAFGVNKFIVYEESDLDEDKGFFKRLWDGLVGFFKNLAKGVMIALRNGLFMMVSSFILLYASFLFLLRMVAFVLCLITSPVAVLGYFLPQLKAFKDDWWKRLNSNIIFGFVFMVLFYVALLMGKNLNEAKFTQTAGAGETGEIITFLIVIMIFYFAIKWSKTMGIVGTETAGKLASKAIFTGTAKLGQLTARGTSRALDAGASRMKARNKTQFLTRGAMRLAAKRLDTMSADVRNVPGLRRGAQALGVGVGTKTSAQSTREFLAKKLEEYVKPTAEKDKIGAGEMQTINSNLAKLNLTMTKNLAEKKKIEDDIKDGKRTPETAANDMALVEDEISKTEKDLKKQKAMKNETYNYITKMETGIIGIIPGFKGISKISKEKIEKNIKTPKKGGEQKAKPDDSGGDSN